MIRAWKAWKLNENALARYAMSNAPKRADPVETGPLLCTKCLRPVSGFTGDLCAACVPITLSDAEGGHTLPGKGER